MKHTALLGTLVLTGIALVGCQNTTTQTTYDADSRKDIIPASCQTFFDGCNQCRRMEDGGVACTKMYCETYEKPQCLDGDKDNTPATQPERPSEEEIQTLTDEYLGLDVQAAQELAEKQDRPFRIVEQDGEALPATLDYRPGRINASVEDGKVTSINRE